MYGAVRGWGAGRWSTEKLVGTVKLLPATLGTADQRRAGRLDFGEQQDPISILPPASRHDGSGLILRGGRHNEYLRRLG
jgi:hypothetical protein